MTLRYHFALRAMLLSIPVLAAGCDRAMNTFQVRAEGAASAHLILCGQFIPLGRTDGRFTGTLPIRCEGASVIQVGFPVDRQSAAL